MLFAKATYADRIPACARLERVLKRLGRNEIKEIFIATGYLRRLIRSVCRDANPWNMRITHKLAVEPLETIGLLWLLREQLDTPFRK
jgi:NDP-sugar pyrophosphorylase family protein